MRDNPRGRAGRPSDPAALISFLCSAEGSGSTASCSTATAACTPEPGWTNPVNRRSGLAHDSGGADQARVDRHDVRMRSSWRAAGAGLLLTALAACSSGASTSVTSVEAVRPPTGTSARPGTKPASDRPTWAGRTCRRRPPARCGPCPPGGGATIAGCPLFPADNPWRQDISAARVAPTRRPGWPASERPRTCTRTSGPTRRTASRSVLCRPASEGLDPVHRLRRRERPRAYPIPADARVEAGGDAHVLVARATATSTSCTALSGRAVAGLPRRARCSTSAPTPCGRPGGHRPTRPGCRSCRAWCGATRSGPGRSTMRCGSPCPGRRAATSTRRPTRPGQLQQLAAADGRAVPPEGVVRHLRLPW